MNKLFQASLWIALICGTPLAKANDDFNNYFADLYLNESHQFRAPNKLIRYSDTDNGPLLKSVLDPQRAKAAITQAFQEINRSKSSPPPIQAFTPLLARYETAFTANGAIYENEYLDAIEISATLMAGSTGLFNQTSESASSTKDASPKTAEQIKLSEMMRTMTKSINSLNNSLRSNIAAKVKEQIRLGKFSADGLKRAVNLVTSFEAPN